MKKNDDDTINIDEMDDGRPMINEPNQMDHQKQNPKAPELIDYDWEEDEYDKEESEVSIRDWQNFGKEMKDSSG